MLLAESVRELKQGQEEMKIMLKRTLAEGKVHFLRLEEVFCFLIILCFAEKSVAISGVSAADYQDLLSRCRLVLVPATFPDSYGGKEVPAFQWSDEDEPKQETRYLAHLKEIIRLRERHLRWESINGTKNLFQGHVPGYKLVGTADVAVRDTRLPADNPSLIRASLALIVELKRKFDGSSFHQGVLELVAHSSMGETMWPPLVLVTDLNDTWRFLWLNDGSKICVLSGTRAQSVKLISDIFNHEDLHVPGFQQLNERGGLKLDLQIHGGMGAPDVGNLDDVSEVMTDEEKRIHKGQATVKMCLQANPWLSMYCWSNSKVQFGTKKLLGWQQVHEKL